jgi:hypothetical protein
MRQYQSTHHRVGYNHPNSLSSEGHKRLTHFCMPFPNDPVRIPRMIPHPIQDRRRKWLDLPKQENKSHLHKGGRSDLRSAPAPDIMKDHIP